VGLSAYGLAEPTLAMRSQSALTLLTCLAHSGLLAMAPAEWTMSPFANRVLTAIRVKEELSAPAIIFVTRSDVPPSPAASFSSISSNALQAISDRKKTTGRKYRIWAASCRNP
jgi:hypothetical protein